MYIIEIFLPLEDNEGDRFPREKFDRVQKELAERFKGVTAFTRSPAEGLWQESPGEITKDQIFIFEVMTDKIDPDWWAQYAKALRREFRQEELLIRATETRRL